MLLTLSACNTVMNVADGDKDGEFTVTNASDFGAQPYRIGNLLWQDDFQSIENWIVEQQPGGVYSVQDNTLTVTDAAGCTVWYRNRLSVPVMIEYEVTVRSTGRVSDLNVFWMASDVDGSPPFELLPDGTAQPRRTGLFSDYHHLKLYYAGCGGNANSTTRFRRYPGTGERPMNPAHDLTDPRFMLEGDRPYRIRLVVRNNRVQYWRDGECFFDVMDSEPLRSGWFGFRLVDSTQSFKNFRVFQLIWS